MPYPSRAAAWPLANLRAWWRRSNALPIAKGNWRRCWARHLTISHLREWYHQITGRDLSVEEFMTLGERVFTLKRIINNQRVISRKDDMLAPRMRTLKEQGDGFDFDVPPLLPMLSE